MIPTPICAQERRGETCRNRLCRGDAGPRYVDGIEAITLHQPPLDRVVSRYKYQGKIGWAIIFARLLTGHLNLEWSPDDVDLIIANPPGPSRKTPGGLLQAGPTPNRRLLGVETRPAVPFTGACRKT